MSNVPANGTGASLKGNTGTPWGRNSTALVVGRSEHRLSELLDELDDEEDEEDEEEDVYAGVGSGEGVRAR